MAFATLDLHNKNKRPSLEERAMIFIFTKYLMASAPLFATAAALAALRGKTTPTGTNHTPSSLN